MNGGLFMNNNFLKILFLIPLLFLLAACSGTIQLPGAEGTIALKVSSHSSVTVELETPADFTAVDCELRVILADGDFDNPSLTAALPDLTENQTLTHVVKGLTIGTDYSARVYCADENASNETPVRPVLGTTYISEFIQHGGGYYILEAQVDDYWCFFGGFAGGMAANPQLGLICVNQLPSSDWETARFTSGQNNRSPYPAVLADFDENGQLDFLICDSEADVFDPNNVLVDSVGQGYVFYNRDWKTFVGDAAFADADPVDSNVIIKDYRFCASAGYDNYGKNLLISSSQSGCKNDDNCGSISLYRFDSQNGQLEFIKKVQEGDPNYMLGKSLMIGDMDGNGAADMAYVYNWDLYGNDTRCAWFKYIMNGFEGGGLDLYKQNPGSGIGCAGEQDMVWGSNRDLDGDGYDDIVLTEFTMDQVMKGRINIFWGSAAWGQPNFDPATVHSDFTGSDGELCCAVNKGDIDADGVEEIILSSDYRAYIVRGRDFDNVETIEPVPFGLGSRSFVDLDGDGYADWINMTSDLLQSSFFAFSSVSIPVIGQ